MSRILFLKFLALIFTYVKWMANTEILDPIVCMCVYDYKSPNICAFSFVSYPDSPGVWFNVSHCNLLKSHICNIGYLPVDSNFKVRVGVLTTQSNIFWSSKRHINIRLSEYLGRLSDKVNHVTIYTTLQLFSKTVKIHTVFASQFSVVVYKQYFIYNLFL